MRGWIKTEHAGAKNGGGYYGRRVEAKTRCRSLRRHADRALVIDELDTMCNCPACRGGYERECWASVVDDNGCPQPGNGGWHSAAYYDDGPCAWCGMVQLHTTLGTLERLP